MQLNIYLLSHPIIQILSNYMRYNYTGNKNEIILAEEKILGFLIFYESMRQWFRIKKLYLQTTKSIEDLYVFNKQQSYYFLTNMYKTYIILEYIKQLIPQINICHIDLLNYASNNSLNTIDHTSNIIIFEKYLDSNTILDYIQFLNKTYNIMITQMTILCFTCNNKILDKIGQKYPTLKIYTTEIMND